MFRPRVLWLTALLVASLVACAPSAERVLGPDSSTYVLAADLFDRDEFVIREADSGLNRYRVEPRPFALGQSLTFQDVEGRTLGRIDRRIVAVLPTFEIYRDDTLVATLGQGLGDVLSNALVGDRTGDTYTVGTEGDAPDYTVEGDVFDLNYRIVQDGRQVANVTKPTGALFGIGDTGNYFVEVASGHDDVLILEIVVAFNELIEAL